MKLTVRLLVLASVMMALAACNGAAPEEQPDTDRIAFHAAFDGVYDIFTINPDGTGVERLTGRSEEPSEFNSGFPVWSPDGSRIAFVSNRDEQDGLEIYTMAADGSDIQRLTDHPGLDRGPVWSPDGSQIAFTSNRDSTLSIYVMNADGSDVRQITDLNGNDQAVSWAPDGSTIVFQSNRNGNLELWSASLETGALTQLTAQINADIQPDWSPNGDVIAFALDLTGVEEEGSEVLVEQRAIYLINPDGTGMTPLVDIANWIISIPRWSPDGQYIAFRSVIGESSGVYVVNVDDPTDITTFRENDDNNNWITWSPDSTALAFEATNEVGTVIYIATIGSDEVLQIQIADAEAVGAPDWSPTP